MQVTTAQLDALPEDASSSTTGTPSARSRWRRWIRVGESGVRKGFLEGVGSGFVLVEYYYNCTVVFSSKDCLRKSQDYHVRLQWRKQRDSGLSRARDRDI